MAIRTYEIPTNLRSIGGYYAVYNRTTDSFLLPPTVFSVSVFDFDLDDQVNYNGTDNVSIYVSVNVTQTVAYETNVINITPGALVNETVTIDGFVQYPDYVWTNYLRGAELGTASEYNVNFSSYTSGRAQLNFSFSGTLGEGFDDRLYGSSRTLFYAIEGRNNNNGTYLTAMAVMEKDEDIIQPFDGVLAVYTDDVFIDSGNNNQQVITGISRVGSGVLIPNTFTYNSGALSIPTVFVYTNPAGLTAPEITSAFEFSLQPTENALGYIVSNGDSTTPATDKFIGIKPKRNDYIDTTDYTGVIK